MASHLKIVLLTCLLSLLVLLEEVKPVLAKKEKGIKKRVKMLEESVVELKQTMKEQDKTIKELEEEVKEQDARMKEQDKRIKTLEECEACSKIEQLNETLNDLEEKIYDLDECTTNTDSCDVHAVCTNTPGSYTCTCKAGFSGGGESCTDIDECVSGVNDCDSLASCTNTVGSYTCSCNEPYIGDGKSCTLPEVNCDCWRSRSRSPSRGWGYSTTPGSRVDAIDFQTSGNVNLKGYRLWGVQSGSATFTVTIRLYQESSLIAEKSGSYFTSSSDQTFEVFFPQEISIRAGVVYTATADINTSQSSFYLNDGMNSASCSGVTVTFSLSSKDSNSSSVSRGQIPALIFSAQNC